MLGGDFIGGGGWIAVGMGPALCCSDGEAIGWRNRVSAGSDIKGQYVRDRVRTLPP